MKRGHPPPPFVSNRHLLALARLESPATAKNHPSWYGTAILLYSVFVRAGLSVLSGQNQRAGWDTNVLVIVYCVSQWCVGVPFNLSSFCSDKPHKVFENN